MMDSIDINDCWNKTGIFSRTGRSCPELEKFGHCRNCPTYCQSGRRLLDRAISETYKKELIVKYKQVNTKKQLTYDSTFVFKAGSEWLALGGTLVTEVVDMGPIHSIPHKNSRLFRGVVNIRGRLEICVSIGGVLRMDGRHREKRGVPTPERLIVAVKEGQSVVFPVTEVLGPIRYDKSMINPLPISISGSKAVYTKGIISLAEKEIGLLDDNILFKILTRNLA